MLALLFWKGFGRGSKKKPEGIRKWSRPFDRKAIEKRREIKSVSRRRVEGLGEEKTQGRPK